LRNSLGARRPPPVHRGAQRHGSRRRQDVSSKAIAYAEQNVQASLDHAQSLLKAKDLTEVMRLHSEYVQAQMRALAEQASEIGQTVGKAAMDAAKPRPDRRHWRGKPVRVALWNPHAGVKFAATHQKLQCAAQI
jgi:hypothetical protein